MGQLPTALPNSATIREYEIKSVLSIIDFEADPKQKESNHNKSILRDLYYSKERTDYSKSILHQGILYHHINVPDFANPDLVFDEHYSLPHLFGESVAFIDATLPYGNVLVHCERGQYRSPTVLIAWLICHGKNTSEAISLIGEEYEDWADKYRKNRPLWIDKLQRLEKKKSTILTYWSKKYSNRITAWKSHYVPETIIKEPKSLKRKRAPETEQPQEAKEIITTIKT